MNNPNPFVPQGSVLEQNKRRSRMKFAVGCVVIAGAAGLTAMLIQGCKREQPTENPTPAPNPFVDTNPPPVLDTNPPPMVVSNPTPAFVPPVAPAPVAPEATGKEYKVVKGDILAKIAKANGVTLKALEAANPGVEPTKLKVGQKITIPAGGSAAPTATGTSASPETTGGTGATAETYTVKSKDTFSKIAKANGVSLKALEAANPNVDPNHIKVGQKLKLPAKTEAAAPVTAPPAAPAASEPMTPPISSPPPVGTPSGR